MTRTTLEAKRLPHATRRPMRQAMLGLSLFATVAGCSRTSDPHPAAAIAPATAAAEARAPLDGGAEAPLDATKRRALLDAMVPLIDAHYLAPAVGTAMIAALRAHDAKGDYATATRSEDFAKSVTQDLRAVSHDVHVMLRYSPDPGREGPTKEEQDEYAALEARFGFVSTERWAGNVALLRVDAFDLYPDARVLSAYAEQLSKVADADALVLDLRENFGGYPETVALLLSYLFDGKPVHLNDLWDRDEDKTFESWTRAEVAGARFGGKKPVFVLTSKRTISGGEEAAYDLQTQKRATLVGETTAGGANFAPRHKLDEHFTLLVPQGRAINPVTRTNWEGVGVVPDVAVDAAAAPREAHVRAVRALVAGLGSGPDARRKRAELERVLADLEGHDAGR